MTTATKRHPPLRLMTSLLGLALAASGPAHAIPVDDRGDMKLGLRAYTNVRIGTETTGGDENTLSWPRSGAGHVRQHRYFLQLKFDHDLKRLAQASYAWLGLLGLLDLDGLSYSLQYRGEGEGIYDYGASEFTDPASDLRALRLDAPDTQVGTLTLSSSRIPEEFIQRYVKRLNERARQKHRLFLGYLDVEKGPLFVRVGRQILAWGETDIFRLLDNINPLDDGFGGFFISLDERRVPLEMVRTSWRFGNVGPLADAYVEGFVASGKRVSQIPGIPAGSPWSPGGIASPRPQLLTLINAPDAADVRGGARLVFNHGDVTYTLAHYYTYLDVPGGRFVLPGSQSGFNSPRFDNPILAYGEYPRVPITGGALTFPVPSWYLVVRSEAAYFQDEPMNRQGRGDSADGLAAPGSPGFNRLRRQNNTEGGLDPFVWPRFLDQTRTRPFWGRVLQRDTFNMSVGLDVNRFVRWINPNQTVFLTTQFFYKHVFDSPGDLVLPTPARNIEVSRQIPFAGTPGCAGGSRPCRLRPRLYHLDDDRFLHTLLITTSYSGGRIVPAFAMFYDWQGPLLFQPGVALVRDPFRFIVDYTRIEGPATGQIGTVRDRDNLRFQVEFVF
jgi:hypothetical protein